MDYLRRLQTQRAEPAGAAHVDLGSRYAPVRSGAAPGPSLRSPWLDGPGQGAAGAGSGLQGQHSTLHRATTAAPVDTGSEPTTPTQAQAQADVAPQRPASTRPRDGLAATKPDHGAASKRSPPQPLQAPGGPAMPGEMPDQPASAAGPLPVAGRATARDRQRAGGYDHAALPHPSPADPAPPAHPLRASSLPASPPAAAPPVVHVTIDRIDVHLPPLAAAGPARRARPPAAAPTLADYLRGQPATPGPR